MKHRLPTLIALAGLPALMLAVLLVKGALGAASGPPTAVIPARISFQIATGSTAGTYFPVGEAIAGLIKIGRAHV